MVVVYTLLEVLALAKEGLKGNKAAKEVAAEAAAKKIMPWTPQISSLEFLSKNYHIGQRSSLDGLVTPVQETGREFIFDNLSSIFVQHGGMEFINNQYAEPVRIWYNPNSNAQFSSRYKRVLHTQHTEGLTSIVIGKVPEWIMVRKKQTYPWTYQPLGMPKERTRPIDNSVYLYIEADNSTMPGFVGPVDGDVQMSLPILYLTTPFDENAPIRERGLKSKVVILLPNEFYDRIGPGAMVRKVGTPRSDGF